jgi:hypothetical protein
MFVLSVQHLCDLQADRAAAMSYQESQLEENMALRRRTARYGGKKEVVIFCPADNFTLYNSTCFEDLCVLYTYNELYLWPLLASSNVVTAIVCLQGEEIDLSDGTDKLVKHIIRPGNGELIPLDCKAIVHYIGRFEVVHIYFHLGCPLQKELD